MSADRLAKAVEDGLVSTFKLTQTISTSNMMCFDPDGSIKKYNNAEEIIQEFYAVRLQYYQKRKVFVCHGQFETILTIF